MKQKIIFEDIKKAQWYLNKLIEIVSQKPVT